MAIPSTFTRQMLNKVPEVTAAFLALKIMAATVGRSIASATLLAVIVALVRFQPQRR